MTNVLTLPIELLNPTTYTAEPAVSGGSRSDFQTELSIAATRFEFAVGVGATLGGIVGLGVGAVGGCLIGAAPASAVGAVVGGAALGIPVGIYSLAQLNSAVAQPGA
ncbi:hypothetical protein [Mycobacterium sp. OTB74]|uniref:hypothetical protein n=1 Tax=Mycobacterium sp. OTB74 TaxID=1853452 RepID=UPI002475495B|nr:hypothetical protein [Mycobacterium sp. OTB74]MDH6245091.1 hypothetical protein [Mycobacterium sp. OTB74]